MQGTKLPSAYPVLVAHLDYHGITHGSLADVIGISGSAFSNIIRGRARPSYALKMRIAEVLERDVDDLWQLHPEIERMVRAAEDQGFPREALDPLALRQVATVAADSANERTISERK